MPTKSKSRAKPRSASKATTRARKRASTIGLSGEDKVKRAEQEAGRPANPDGSVPQGEASPLSASTAPGELAGPVVGAPQRFHRHVIGKEHAVTGSGAPHPTAEGATPTKGAADSERYQAIVGPPESLSPSAAMDNAQRAASKNDLDAAAEALPPGTTIEALGNFHGFRIVTPGMHKIEGHGKTILDAIKNLGVPLVRDEELPDDQKSAARRAQEAKEAYNREQAGPAAGAGAAAA